MSSESEVRNPYFGALAAINKDMATRTISPEQMQKIGELKEQMKSDFANFYSPSEDPYGAPTGGSNDNGRPSLADLEALAQQRVGIGWRITRVMADDAVRNKFYFTDLNDKVTNRPRIKKWLKKTDYYNQLANCLYYERWGGAGFMVKFYGLLTPEERESGKEDLSLPPPKNRKPIHFQAMPPSLMSPTNIYDSQLLDYDESQWEFQGGVVNSSKIHKDRVEVIITRPVAGSWRGVSILEPIWMSISAYYNCIIYLTKGIAKWGNTVPVLKMGDSETGKDAFDNWLDLMIQYQMNYFYLIGKNDDLEFVNAQLGSGITEYTEFLKEDISAGTGIPLNLLFGRSASGGLGGEGALSSERFYMNQIANIQLSITDNCENIIGKYFNIENNLLVWNLATQKTKEQRLREENMELQNETLRLQNKSIKLQNESASINNKISKIQAEQIMKNPELLNQPPKAEGEESGQTPKTTPAPKQTTSDFATQVLLQNQQLFPPKREPKITVIQQSENK